VGFLSRLFARYQFGCAFLYSTNLSRHAPVETQTAPARKKINPKQKCPENLVPPCNPLLATSIPSTSRIVVLPVVVSNLTSRRSAPVLSTLLESRIQIRADDAFVQFGAAHILHSIQRVGMGVVLDEAKAAGGLIEAVKAHDQTFDLAAFGEQLVDLLFGCVEGAVCGGWVRWRRLQDGDGEGLAYRLPTYSVAASFRGSSRGASGLVR
jgi:hypothetical protein